MLLHLHHHLFALFQRFGPDFPTISDSLMPNKPATLLRYRYKAFLILFPSRCQSFFNHAQIRSRAAAEENPLKMFREQVGLWPIRLLRGLFVLAALEGRVSPAARVVVVG